MSTFNQITSMVPTFTNGSGEASCRRKQTRIASAKAVDTRDKYPATLVGVILLSLK